MYVRLVVCLVFSLFFTNLVFRFRSFFSYSIAYGFLSFSWCVCHIQYDAMTLHCSLPFQDYDAYLRARFVTTDLYLSIMGDQDGHGVHWVSTSTK